jgi:hypothetical protein
MTRNLKALGLATLAVLALGALTAQGASAAKEHEFASDGEWTVGTGENIKGNWNLAVGTAGTVECESQYEDDSQGSKVSEGTFHADQITVTAHLTGCTFAGSPAVFNTNHCAFVLDSDTTVNSEEKELASVEIECSGGTEIEIDTSVCTITVPAQVVKHAIEYREDKENSVTAMEGIIAAKKVKTGKKKTTESQTGCLLFPTGEIGTASGTGTTECFKDENEKWLSGTEKTTPTSKTKEGKSKECSVTNL